MLEMAKTIGNLEFVLKLVAADKLHVLLNSCPFHAFRDLDEFAQPTYLMLFF